MLINSVVYRDGHKLADIALEDAPKWLNEPQCFVWVALKDASPEEIDHVQDLFGLHDLVVEDTRKGQQRPKLEEYGETLFAVMHLVSVNGEHLEQGEVAVCVGRNFVLSVRSRSSQNFLGVRARCEREPELLRQGAGFVFYALMDAVVDHYFPVIEALETELEDIEEHIFDRNVARPSIQRLYTLKRKLATLRHAAAPLLEVTSKLHGGRVPPVCLASQEYFRDVHDHLERINNAIEAMRETIGTAIQVNLSMVTIEESEITKRLAAWAAIFAVPTAFAGIWGMNFDTMPELRWVWGYPVALGVMAGVSGWLWRRFRQSGWL